MQIKNLTPFDVLCYVALDKANLEHHVIAMKVGYRLLRGSDGKWSAVVMDDEPVALCLADDHYGEPNLSSVRQESDLAPCKPRCDFVLQATAWSPNGKPAEKWQIGVRVSASPLDIAPPEPPLPLNPWMPLSAEQERLWQQQKALHRQASKQPRVLMDKQLVVQGPSEFRKTVLSGWQRSCPKVTTEVPARWEHAFGGGCFISDPRDSNLPPLLNEVCFSNPLGKGWIEQRWLKLRKHLEKSQQNLIPAPQVEYPNDQLAQPVITSQPETNLNAQQMAQLAESYKHRSAGLGPVGRSWTPRLALAGNYDQHWLDHQHPGLPADFNFAYWNGAPADQQIEYLPPDARIETWNLTPPDLTPDGHLDVTLPGHRPFVLAYLDGGYALPLPMITDTALLDTEGMMLSLTHRTWVPQGMSVTQLEARFEVNPQAPLLRQEQPEQEAC